MWSLSKGTGRGGQHTWIVNGHPVWMAREGESDNSDSLHEAMNAHKTRLLHYKQKHFLNGSHCSGERGGAGGAPWQEYGARGRALPPSCRNKHGFLKKSDLDLPGGLISTAESVSLRGSVMSWNMFRKGSDLLCLHK